MTINEIAQMAGVSRATVSRYLNDGYVSEEKRIRIREVIERTGYQPSAQAQNLRTKRTRQIGVILPKINSDSVSRMVAGISHELSREGFQLLLANTENDEKEELKYLKLFKENQVDGIILIGTIFTAEHKKVMKDLNVPIVILSQNLPGYSCVYHDDYQAAKAITEVLIRNSKRIGYIGVTKKDRAAGEGRFAGFWDALQEASMECPEHAQVQAEFTVESGYEAAGILMEQYKEADAIFCATDSIAFGAMLRLRELGKRIPEDIQITGVGDNKIGNFMIPKLSTVHLFYKTSGMEAAKMLLDILRTGNEIRKEMKMGYKVLEKESTRLME